MEWRAPVLKSRPKKVEFSEDLARFSLLSSRVPFLSLSVNVDLEPGADEDIEPLLGAKLFES